MFLVFDAIGLLYFADETHDLCDIVVGNLRLRRHRAEAPMVLCNAVARRQQERDISMMPGVIDAVYQRRALVAAGTVRAVTLRAIGLEQGLTRDCRLGKDRHHDIHGLRGGLFGGPENENDNPCCDQSAQARDAATGSGPSPGHA